MPKTALVAALTTITLSMLVGFQNCQKKEDDSPFVPDPVFGEWKFETETSPGRGTRQPGSIKGISASVKEDGSIHIVYAYANATGSGFAFRKMIGSFKRHGDKFDISYSYETCNPVSNETLIVRINPKYPDQLFVESLDGSLSFYMDRVENAAAAYQASGVEDKGCTPISKTQSKDRSPASSRLQH